MMRRGGYAPSTELLLVYLLDLDGPRPKLDRNEILLNGNKPCRQPTKFTSIKPSYLYGLEINQVEMYMVNCKYVLILCLICLLLLVLLLTVASKVRQSVRISQWHLLIQLQV